MTNERQIPLPTPHLCIALAISLAACSGGGPDSGAAVRDSAGIRIVENQEPLWTENRRWRLSDQPLLDIGVLEGAADYQLFQVAGAVRLTDGRIVIANAGTGELRFYDPAGRYLSSAGRRGRGPGEFEFLRWLGTLRGDSLVAYDWRNRRVSIFDADGKFERAFTLRTLAQAPPSHIHLGLFADGSVLIGAQRLFASGEIRTGVYHDSIFCLRFDQQGVLTDTIGRQLGAEVYILAHDQGIELVPLPFAPSPHLSAYTDGFYFGRGDSYEIAYYSTEGRLVRSIRRIQPRTRVSAADIERYMQRQLAGIEDEDERREIEHLYAGLPFPETMPAYSDVSVDVDGNLWVEDYQRPGEDQPRRTVFNPDGVMLGVVEMPPRFTVYQIGSDFVLGRWRDDLDVEHIHLYALLKD
ncbi:MAG: hypothetical protein JSV41_06515 [Gemmatimonadota bacterium]|nr:MAG: hypothetical protein JSV41_06515 [Gemmatimonadota bacterium]